MARTVPSLRPYSRTLLVCGYAHVLLLASSSPTQPAACPSSIHNNTAFHSAESFVTIAVPTDDPLACCAACVGNASCASWTAQLASGRCHLKHGVPSDGGEPSTGSISGLVPGRGPPPPAPWPAPPSSDKLNIVLVVSDDMRPSLGVYDQPAISPHLDAFAKQGTVFQNAYVQVAWCSPCRNSFLSGRRPDRTHIWTTPGTEPGLGFRAHGADWVTLPGYFKGAGYITTAGGKVFHPNEPANNDPISWTDSASCPHNNSSETSMDPFHGPCTYWKYSFGGYDTCKNTTASCKHCENGAWCSVVDSEPTADETTAAIMTKRLRDIQASNTTRPFFMAIGFLKPHLPYAAPARYYDAVDAKWDPAAGGFPIANATAMQMPLNAPRLAWYDYFATLSDRNGVKYCHNPQLKAAQCTKPNLQGHVSMNDTFATAPLRDLARGYSAAISMVDEQFGKVVRTLDELALSEKTVVMFVGDHGQNLGEHNTFSKMTLYETSLRAPMIVRAPGGKPANTITSPVEFLDIYPTLVSLAGLPAPSFGIGKVEGADLAPLILHGAARQASVSAGAAYSQVTRCRASYDKEIGPCSAEFGLTNASQFDWMGMSVRTATHRYVEWRNWSGSALAPVWTGPAAGVELYAHTVGDGDFDAYVNGEGVNIAKEAASAPVVEALAAQIRTVFKTDDRAAGSIVARPPAGPVTTPLECTSATDHPLWPTFHIFNNVSRIGGLLHMEGLNDCNGVLEYKGIFHLFVQGGLGRNGMVGDWSTGGWTHAVSNDLVTWFHVKDALGRGPSNSTWDHDGPCDGTLSLMDEVPSHGTGSAPLIIYGPDCADRLPKSARLQSSDHQVELGDYPRIALARGSAVDPYLLTWTKQPPGKPEPVSFDGPPCSFPGRVWRSEVGNHYNMLCSFGQGKSWARFISTTPTLLSWRMADEEFTKPNIAGGGGGALFHKIPNAPADGPTHLINGNTGSEFWLGNYDSTREVMNITSTTAQKIDFGTLFDWAAAGSASDGRLLLIGKVDGNPGAGRSYVSLIREMRFDRQAGQLTSQPVAEYERLRNHTFVEQQRLRLPARGKEDGPIMRTLFAGGAAGGALDLVLSFDLGPPTDELWSGFGVAVRSPPHTVEGAAMRLSINVSAADGNGVRTALVSSIAPTLPPPPQRKETLPVWLNGTDLDDWESAAGEGTAHFPEGTKPEVCQALCASNPDCKAWTHEMRHQGPGVECRLRNGKATHGASVLPCPLANALCTSGAKASALTFTCEPKESTWIAGGGNSNFSVKVLPGEALSLRLLVDRPIIELFAQGGRAALVAADQIFSLENTSVHLFNVGERDVAVTASLHSMGCGWASSLPAPKPAYKSDDIEPIGWWTFDSADGASVPDRAGHGAGRMDLAGTSCVSLGVENAFALRLFGNTSSDSLSINSSALNSLDEWSLSFWVNFLWGDPSGPTLCSKGDQLSYLQLYDGYLKYEMKAAGGKIENVSYPHQCGWLQPGTWTQVTFTFTKATGTATLYMNGAQCHNTTVGKGGLKHAKDDLVFTNFSGFIADVRAYGTPLSATAVAKLHSTSAPIYNRTAVRYPSSQEVKALNRGWKPFPQLPGDDTMHKSWLNYDALAPQGGSADQASLLSIEQIVWAGGAVDHPPRWTAVSELMAVLPNAVLAKFDPGDQAQRRRVLIGTCSDAYIAQAVGSTCPVAGHEAFALRVRGNDVVVVGGGSAGLLYGAFALVKHVQLGTRWDPSSLDANESPSTAIRLLNHWSVWRGNPQDAWMPARTNRSALPHGPFHEGGSSGPYDDGADRSDSIFSWDDLRDGPSANSTARIRAWARLLASVGINSIAPQDVNWFEPNNFLEHLAEVETLGTILRGFAIKLFWTPNFLLAPQQEVADKLFRAVPDFGGYLLKVGSESQGGIATPENINAIAAVLRRPDGSGQMNGTVVVRGFIYGSQYCKDHDEKKTNRMAIPAMFFGKYDGLYSDNVYIMGKYSALDYETTEPINPLDGLMQHTHYGPDVEVGKGFPMSWASRWEEWLQFDNMRGANGHQLNRETTAGFLGVCIIGNNPSWTDNPLNMINYYAFGRLSWDTTLSASEIHAEFVRRTFGPSLPSAATKSILSVLSDSETAADDLAIYRGYRGVWYKFCDGSHCTGAGLRSSPVNNQVLGPDGAGMPAALASNLLEQYSVGLRQVYSNYTDPRSEKSLLEFGVFPLNFTLTNGRSLIEDMRARPSEGLATAIAMRNEWAGRESDIRAAVGDRFFETTAQELEEFVVIANEMVAHLKQALALLQPNAAP